MKINGTSNNSFQNKVLIDTFIEQISALQTDVGNLQIADDNLAQALATKANTADINTAVNTGTLTSTNGNIKTLKVQGTGSSATIENATIGTASIGTENVTQSNITNLEVMDVDAGTVRTGTLTVENDATISGDMAVQDVSAKDITSASVNTLNVTTAEADVNKLEAQNAEITGKLKVNDLEVSGNFTGVSNIESESVNTEDITADTADIETLDVENIRSWVTQVMNQDQILNPPTPALGNVDTYTIELPRFTGVFLLSWEKADVVWSAAVFGNGKSYGISWGSRTDQNYITDLFQYNGKLYIRINSNGKLKYAYSTTKELDQIVIYRNMNGWTSDKSLEELCDELSHIQNVYSAGTAWLGPVYIPRLLEGNKGAFNFKGSCTFANIPALDEAFPGDVWNITDEASTDNRFIEGAGKPINAGDDIIAVTIKVNDETIIKWDKFSAGIDYENFVVDNITAENITATNSISMGRRAGSTVGVKSIATGLQTEATGTYSHAEGYQTEATNIASHSEGYQTKATEHSAHAEGQSTKATSTGAHAEGLLTEATENFAHAEGRGTKATGYAAHSEGYQTNATESYSHAEGYQTEASGSYSHAEGQSTKATDTGSHAEGLATEATNDYAHAEGNYTKATGYSAHAEGSQTEANNEFSHAEGRTTKANGVFSHTEGFHTIASSEGQHVQGKYNVEDANNVYADIIGYGSDENNRKNIEATTWTGDKRLKGDIYINCNDDSTGGTSLSTALSGKIPITEKGTANGVATLDANGRIPYSQLPESAMEYKGTWDASTNTPTLVDGIGTNGDFYIVSADGTVTFSAGRTFTFYVNDRVIYDGSVDEWVRLPASVDYENFIAENITATESLKSEGTFEVDGNSTFNSNITQTGNYTATGNLNRTGNETISGLVVIGDLN